MQGRSESQWRIIAHRPGGREAQLARGGTREYDAFLGHEMKGPAGTGRGGDSMAGGRELGRPIAGEHPFYVLIYMNSYVFHICFILFS